MKKNQKKISECIGCLNIERQNFPFGKREDIDSHRKGYFIDSEGCGLTDEGDYCLRIYYCPVCGRKLQLDEDSKGKKEG